VDVAAAGALVFVADVVVAAEVGDAVVAALAGTVVAPPAEEVVEDPVELVLGVHPDRAAATVPRVSNATSPAREPAPVPMAGRYSRGPWLSSRWQGPKADAEQDSRSERRSS
jgi:hypothetical protein